MPNKKLKLKTPNLETILIESVRAGLTHKLAAERAGVNPRSLYDWLKKADEGDERFAAFAAAFRRAESDAVLVHLSNIDRAGLTDWRASAWVLEHRHPEDYGKQSTVKLEGNPDKPLTISTITAVLPAGFDDTDSDPIPA